MKLYFKALFTVYLINERIVVFIISNLHGYNCYRLSVFKIGMAQ